MKFRQCFLALSLLAAPAAAAGAQQYRLQREPFRPATAYLPQPNGSEAAADAKDYASFRDSDEARARGFGLVGQSAWSFAAFSFDNARLGRPCSPDLIFNLGLADARADQPATAALWLRAYLAMVPDAANAAAIRSQIDRLAGQAETRARLLFDEAERLANTMSADPVTGAASSLRQDALEDVAIQAYLSGDTARGDRLVAAVRALPSPVAMYEDLEIAQSIPGAFRLLWARDMAGMEGMFARLGASVPSNRRSGYLAQMYLHRYQNEKVEKLFKTMPYDVANRLYLGGDTTADLRDQGHYSILAGYFTTAVSRLQSEPFGEEFFSRLVWFVAAAIFDGRPDLAREIAQAARLYIERHDTYLVGKVFDRSVQQSDRWPQYVLLLAALGDRAAIQQFVPRVNWRLHQDDTLALAETIALATMNAGDAQATIAAISSATSNLTRDDKPITLEASQPLAGFAARLAEGDEAGALKWLERLPRQSRGYDTNFPVDPLFGWRWALRYAVATDQAGLALAIARLMPADGWELPRQLGRLAERPEASDSRRMARAYLAAACEGWRPRDRGHALDVYWRLRRAEAVERFSGEGEGRPITLERLRRESPELIPRELAVFATILAAHAAAAGQDD